MNKNNQISVTYIGDKNPNELEGSELLRDVDLVCLSGKSADLNHVEIKSSVLIFHLKPGDMNKFFKWLQYLKMKPLFPVVLVCVDGFNKSDLIELVNSHDVYRISTSLTKSFGLIPLAFEEYQNKIKIYHGLQKVKNQNKQLELLTDNLEKLVLERTKKQFESSQLAVKSLKDIQELLKFIKQIARTVSIEEILSIIRSDFKKIHGLRAPLMFLPNRSMGLSVFFFQGKQFVEKRIQGNLDVYGDDSDKSEGHTQILRKRLSEVLDRPVSPIETHEIVFKKKSFPYKNGLLVWEHSLDEVELQGFREYKLERWPIIFLALENTLLREHSQRIARQWSNMFNQMSYPVFIIDRSFRVALSNTQVSAKVGDFCYQAFANREVACIGCPVSNAIESGKPASGDIHCMGKVYRAHSNPIELPGESSASYLVNQYIDMTEERGIQVRLIQGEKMAAIGALAGNVAHELNNPLTGISALSGLVLEEVPQDSTIFKDLIEVRDAAIRCQRIIKDLLAFTEPEILDDASLHDINLLVQKTLPLLKMATRDHRCHLFFEEKPFIVRCNPQLFQQVIFNLINNACQAMTTGGDLTIKTRQIGSNVEVLVQDSGPGVPLHLRDAIFDPFFTTKEEGLGTGLGLSMSRSIIEKFGGKLLLNTSFDEGSQFVIKIPLQESGAL